jgi:hypothetical protein
MGQALEACSEAGIVPCYNLLIFEPETRLDDVAENIAFMRRFAEHPVNFCRAEPYLGTPLHRQLAQTGSLSGSFLGWDYRLADDRAELLFRISSAAFRERNFASDGVANRYMGLNYSCGVLDWFYRVGDIRKERLRERARELTKNISHDTAELLEQALDLASQLDPHDDDRIARETAHLGLRVAASDRVWHAALDAMMSDLRAFAAVGRRRETVRRRPAGQVVRAAQGAAFAGWLALWAPGCNSGGLGLPHDGGHRDATADYMIADMLPPADGNTVYDPLPSPDASIVYDPLPSPDASFYQQPDTTIIADPVPPPDGSIVYDPPPPPDTGVVYDPPPPDAGRRDFGPVVDPLVQDAGRRDASSDYLVADTLPPDASRGPDGIGPLPPPDAGRPDAGPDYMIADMLPRSDAGVQKVDAPWPVSDPPVAPIGALSSNRGAPGATEGGGHWADTTPRRSPRARELPLCLPPEIRVAGEWVDGVVQVSLTGAEEPLSVRWQSDGEIVGADRQVIWAPSSDDDQLNVAVRSRDGVAVGELRLSQVRGRRG